MSIRLNLTNGIYHVVINCVAFCRICVTFCLYSCSCFIYILFFKHHSCLGVCILPHVQNNIKFIVSPFSWKINLNCVWCFVMQHAIMCAMLIDLVLNQCATCDFAKAMGSFRVCDHEKFLFNESEVSTRTLAQR